jgi:hypothetical protein
MVISASTFGISSHLKVVGVYQKEPCIKGERYQGRLSVCRWEPAHTSQSKPLAFLFTLFHKNDVKIPKRLISNTDTVFSNKSPYQRLLNPLGPAPKVRSRRGES